MNQKISIVAGSLVIVSAMALAGIVINVSATGADQSAATANAVLPFLGSTPTRSTVPAKPEGIMVPLNALREICSRLPAVQNAIKNGAVNKTETARPVPVVPQTTNQDTASQGQTAPTN